MDILSRKKAQDSGRRGVTPYHFSAKSDKGFTLIEMLVVVAIMMIVSTVVLANNGRFGGQAILQNIAYEIALTIRQAQVYSIAVRMRSSSTGEGEYPAAYGMHFTESDPRTFYLFAEDDLNGVYLQSEDTLIQDYSIRPGYRIVRLCDETLCAGASVENLDVSFRRPHPDAWIFTGRGQQTRGCIELRSPRGDTKAVVITINGQIEVKNKCYEEM